MRYVLVLLMGLMLVGSSFAKEKPKTKPTEEKIVLDEPLTDEQIKILDELPSAQIPAEAIKLDNGKSVTDTLLELDPCYLVKVPSGSKETQKKAKELCDKKQK